VSRADRTSLEATTFEVDRAEVLAVAAVLPKDLGRNAALTFEVDVAEDVTTILTLDWALPRSEETALVFWTEYSHFRGSL
jgi:hypothetical protein